MWWRKKNISILFLLYSILWWYAPRLYINCENPRIIRVFSLWSQRKYACYPRIFPVYRFGAYHLWKHDVAFMWQAGYEVGTKCRMLCMPGFRPHSVGRKKCTADTTWRGEEGECRPLTCPALASPANGRVDPLTCLTGKKLLRNVEEKNPRIFVNFYFVFSWPAFFDIFIPLCFFIFTSLLTNNFCLM